MNKRRVLSLNEIAEILYFNYQPLNKDDLYGWSFRKGKSVEDLRKAVKNTNKFESDNGYALMKLVNSLKRILKIDKSLSINNN